MRTPAPALKISDFFKLRGGLSLAKGEITEAIRLFREAQALVNTWLGRFALGRACLEANAYTDAYSEIEKCYKRYGKASEEKTQNIATALNALVQSEPQA